MKCNFFKATLFAALVMFAGYNVYSSQKSENISDIALANVEALANDEGPNSGHKCYYVFTPADWFHADQIFVDCYTCSQDKGRNFEDPSFCHKY